MKRHVFYELLVWVGLACAGCQEPQNIRMRFAAVLPGEPIQLVGIDAKHRLLLCDARTQEVIRTIGENREPVRELRVSPDGARVAAVCQDGRCRVWNTSGGLAMTVNRAGGEDRGAVAFSHDGRHLACGAVGYIEIYSIENRSLVRRVPDSAQRDLYLDSAFAKMAEQLRESRILSLDFRPTGHLVLVSTDLGVLEIDYLRCSLVWHLSGRAGVSARLVRYAPDGDHFIVQPAAGPLEYYDKHKSIVSFAPQPDRGTQASFTTAEFSHDGTYLALSSTDGAFRVVRLSDQKVMIRVSPGKLDTDGIALAPDGRSAWIGSQGNVERFTRFALPEEMWVKPLDLN